MKRDVKCFFQSNKKKNFKFSLGFSLEEVYFDTFFLINGNGCVY